MAKKKLILNEGVTRRFMKLANVKPMYVSNFINEAEAAEASGNMPAAEGDLKGGLGSGEGPLIPTGE